MKKCYAILFLLAAVLSFPVSAQVPGRHALQAGFRNPPTEARPSAYYLLLNGSMNRGHMVRELEELHAKGVRGLCVFDMGARGPAGTVPPSGPAFMSEAWLENFTAVVRKAGELGMDVQLAVSSSWDMGAAWVTPEDASKALYHSAVQVEGPRRFDGKLPLPGTPGGDGPQGDASEVAVLAVPRQEGLSAHEFILKPAPADAVDHVVLYNTESDDAKRYGPSHLFAKDFSVAVSDSGTSEEDFREVVRGTLKPSTEAQRFDFAPTPAGWVRLRIYNGHNEQFDEVQLGEFEVYSTEGRNVAAGHEADRTREAAELVRFSSQGGHDGRWTADNIYDGARSGPAGGWASGGPPPSVVASADDVIDLSARMDAAGHLQWDVPEGEWTILRFVCANTLERLKVPSPASDGLATDHFSETATRRYIRHLIERLREHLGDLEGTALKQLYLPSYEVRGAVWTGGFVERFEHYRGYDPTRYLPALTGFVIENREATDRFLYDFHKAQGDLLIDAYYRTASEEARKAGLGIEAESGGPGPPVHQVPVDALKALGAIDEMRGEFWPWRPRMSELWVVKETACAAHIYGRRRVHMEAFTGFRHWQDGPFDLKPSADRAFCEGMNHVVWHTSSHQPPEAGKPGWVYGAGTHLTPNLAWWPMAGAFLDYLSRCSFLLQQGLFVGDVCYYYGDDAYNFVPPKHVDPSLGYGYDYDVVNAEVILTRMAVRDGRIVLPDGMGYELLVLPEREDMDPVVLRKVMELVRAGATIVGPRPTRSSGLHEFERRDREVRRLAEELWGGCDGETVLENRYGKGKVVWGRPPREVLEARGLGPDFGFTSRRQDTEIDFIHRRTSEAEIYFVRNKRMEAERIDARFRVTGKTPQLWMPDTGEVMDAPAHRQADGCTHLSLSLPPAGSVFVVFQEEVSHPAAAGLGEASKLAALEVSGPWAVTFEAGRGAPESAVFKRLLSWTEHEQPGIRYFSGIAEYRNHVDVPSGWLTDHRRISLDLGDLWAVAEIRVNDRPAGVVWKPPYRVDVTDAVQPGRNRLTIRVANTWANRLVGDALSPPQERICRTNITGSGTPRKAWKDIPPRRSGLFGPVRLIGVGQKQPPGHALFQDLHFQQGFLLSYPDSSQGRSVEAVLDFGDAGSRPVWRLCQWATRYSLAGAPCIRDDKGDRRYENDGKRVVVGGMDSASRDLILEIRGSAEYGPAARKKGEPWPHLLIEQDAATQYPLAALDQLRLAVDLQLQHCTDHTPSQEYDPGLHAAQFQLFFIVRNIAQGSPDHNDFFWFGVPFFDSRHAVPPAYMARDAGKADATGKFIYTVAGSDVGVTPMEPGRWLTVETDLLPFLRRALEEAVKRGYLDDADPAHYAIVNMNLGWEIPGVFDAAIQVRDLHISAI